MAKRVSFICFYFIVFANIVCLKGQLQQPGLPIIKKCSCKSSEVESRQGCIEVNVPLGIQMWNEAINDGDIKNVTSLPFLIQPLKCPQDSVVEKVFEWAFISADGQLLHSGIHNEAYCIEYVVNEAGVISQRIEKCVGKSDLNLCCKITEYLDSSARCTSIPGLELKTSIAEFLNHFHYTVKNIQCSNSDIVHYRFPLNTPINLLREDFQDFDAKTEGKFCLGMYGDENELYPGITYCSSEKSYIPVSKPEVRYCCEEGQAYVLSLGKCVYHTENFKFPQYFEWPSGGAITSLSIMNCFQVVPFEEKNNVQHYFLPNGSVFTGSGKIIHETEYCLGIIVSEAKTYHSGLTCLKNDTENHICPWRWEVYRICLGISSFFLFLTLIVYIGVPDLRRRIAGVCLISELLALLVSQITLIVIQTKGRDFSASGCLAVGVVEIVFVLASFFWLNIMCYDVWTTFRVLRPYSEKLFQVKLFLKYSLYGWGLPILIGVTAAVLQMTDIRFNPNFTPETNCFFGDDDLILQWIYLYGIILLLLLINLFFFIHLAFTMIRSHLENQKHLKGRGGNTSEYDQNMENFKLHGKLFIIMGLPWIIEALTSFATSESECYIWFLDLINMLRGVLIFIIFVFKKSTRDKLLAAWCSSYKPPQETSRSSRKMSTTTTSFTNWLPSIKGRKISKVSMASGGQINLEALNLKDESQDTVREGNFRSMEDNDVFKAGK